MPKTQQIMAIEDWCRLHRGKLNHEQIIAEVCKVFGLRPEYILTPGRGVLDKAETRRWCIYFLRHLGGYTQAVIAREMKRDDHSTITNSLRRTNCLLDARDVKATDELFKAYDHLKLLLNERV